ncbi:hypothetical protein, conserved [Plasmodium gonderi]|uniref:Uncharacterized protein n=1 Tax=Plasmodium gonderi TaxID=77519 RepID=A0A1Y1JG27_PLAGO|nr:hypothetical protein, conserved [Plasmodium gonderi]GAW79712.1 hypothetical protein, conserved [Plasmodium gonderi]
MDITRTSNVLVVSRFLWKFINTRDWVQGRNEIAKSCNPYGTIAHIYDLTNRAYKFREKKNNSNCVCLSIRERNEDFDKSSHKNHDIVLDPYLVRKNKNKFVHFQKKAIKQKKELMLENVNKRTLSKLSLQIEELDYRQLVKYKNVKNVIVLKDKKEVLQYLNSYLLNNNKAKYYILKVLMFSITARMSTYQVKELIYILYVYKKHNFLNPYIIFHIMNKLSMEVVSKSMTVNEFVFMVDILTVPLIMSNKFEKMIQGFICINVNKFKFSNYFVIGYFLARNNLYNETVLNYIAHFYKNCGIYLDKWDEKREIIKENENTQQCENKSLIVDDKKDRVTADDTSLQNMNLIHFTKDIHKHLFILAKYGYTDVYMYSNIFKIIISRCGYLRPLEISSILKSLQNLNYYNSCLFKMLVKNLKKNLSQYKTNLLLDCLNSLSYFNHIDDELITKILVRLPRTISTYTSNDFVKLVFFMNNFIPFSIYFSLFINQQILYFSSSFNMLHLISLLKIFTNQRFISNPIFYLLNIKLEKFISTHSWMKNPLNGVNNEKYMQRKTAINAKYNITFKNLFEIIHIMNFMSVKYTNLIQNCLESMFIIQNEYEQLHFQEIKYMTYSCCYFILLNDFYDVVSSNPLYQRIQNFFYLLDPSLVDVSQDGGIECSAKVENSKKVDNAGNTEKVENAGNTEKVENADNTEKVENAGNTEKVENAGNTEKVENAGNTEKNENADNTEMDGNTEMADNTEMDGNTEMADNTETDENIVEYDHLKENSNFSPHIQGCIHGEILKNITYNEFYEENKIMNKIRDKKMEINIYSMIIRTFLEELIYNHSKNKMINVYNFRGEYMKYIFSKKIDSAKEYNNNDCVLALKKLFPIMFYPHIDKSLLKNVPVNRYFISTYLVGFPLEEEFNQFIQSEHVKREMSYHQKSLNDMYEVLKSLPQLCYKFRIVKEGKTNSTFLYTHYIFAKNVVSKKKVAILFGTKNYFYTKINKLQIGLNSRSTSNLFDKEYMTKGAIAQLQYFKMFFNSVYLVPVHVWENMDLEKKKLFFVNMLNLSSEKVPDFEWGYISL